MTNEEYVAEWNGRIRAAEIATPTPSAIPPNIRDAFEAFGQSMGWDLERFEHGYSDCNVDYAWTGYVAALRDQMAASHAPK
jgi:hypothetical protein